MWFNFNSHTFSQNLIPKVFTLLAAYQIYIYCLHQCLYLVICRIVGFFLFWFCCNIMFEISVLSFLTLTLSIDSQLIRNEFYKKNPVFQHSCFGARVQHIKYVYSMYNLYKIRLISTKKWIVTEREWEREREINWIAFAHLHFQAQFLDLYGFCGVFSLRLFTVDQLISNKKLVSFTYARDRNIWFHTLDIIGWCYARKP